MITCGGCGIEKGSPGAPRFWVSCAFCDPDGTDDDFTPVPLCRRCALNHPHFQRPAQVRSDA